MVLKETQTFRVNNPSQKGYIPETSVFLSKPFLILRLLVGTLTNNLLDANLRKRLDDM